MGEVEGYSSTAFWPRQEFDFAAGGILEWSVNLSAPHARSWWEIQIMPRQELQAAAVNHTLGADETYPAELHRAHFWRRFDAQCAGRLRRAAARRNPARPLD